MCGGYEHIAITGGTVYAEGYFIGIGGECSQTRGIIEISGGIVYAIGREEAVAIGNNAENSDGVILITGGVVYAQVDNYDWYLYEEAAMGCDHGTIRFDGGIVYANGSILLDAENAELIITDGLVSVNGQILERTDGK